MEPVRFKLDTGADASTISKINLSRLGYDMDWIRKNTIMFNDDDKPTTASGDKINAGCIQLPLINIFGYEGKHWPFQIIIDEDKDFRNLLGNDLLTGFNYWFNNDEGIFSIEMAKSFKPRFSFLFGQEINEILTKMDTHIKHKQGNTQNHLNIGDFIDLQSYITEAIFSTELYNLFFQIGFVFTKQAGPNVKFYKNGQVFAYVDFLLENGEYVMLVEVKADLSIRYVDAHLDRIRKIRSYMDFKGDGRKIIGAVAGGFVPDDALVHAQENGLFVVVQTGKSVAIANSPDGFTLREW